MCEIDLQPLLLLLRRGHRCSFPTQLAHLALPTNQNETFTLYDKQQVLHYLNKGLCITSFAALRFATGVIVGAIIAFVAHAIIAFFFLQNVTEHCSQINANKYKVVLHPPIQTG
jgi:hypothetical protein